MNIQGSKRLWFPKGFVWMQRTLIQNACDQKFEEFEMFWLGGYFIHYLLIILCIKISSCGTSGGERWKAKMFKVCNRLDFRVFFFWTTTPEPLPAPTCNGFSFSGFVYISLQGLAWLRLEKPPEAYSHSCLTAAGGTWPPGYSEPTLG